MNSRKSVLSIPPTRVDPALVALFDSSARPIQGPPKHRYLRRAPVDAGRAEPEPLPQESDPASPASSQEGPGTVGRAGEANGPIEQQFNRPDVSESSESEASGGEDQPRTHKRKREDHDATDEVEAEYFARTFKSQQIQVGQLQEDSAGSHDSFDDASSESVAPLVHESLEQDPLEKASRTVFLSNVSTEAITSRAAKKRLLSHLSSVLDKVASPMQSIISLRFRSIPVSSTSIPKRAAYIKKAVMDATTKSTNAYVVYSTASAARLAVSQLNATTVLGRHLRVDSVAHPSPTDHRRCVFVGNLGFVDDESLLKVNITEDGKEQVEKRKRTKSPMDVEEGLWRVFGDRAGKVESVRVVRDSKTRVGKGFAYVQFYDPNSVEAALLLSGEKFPPQLPRVLRVSRCKAPHKTARAVERAQSKKLASSARSIEASGSALSPAAENRTVGGRTAKLFGKSAASRGQSGTKRDNRRSQAGKGEMLDTVDRVARLPGSTVFEGQRASTRDRKRNLRTLGRRKVQKPNRRNNK